MKFNRNRFSAALMRKFAFLSESQGFTKRALGGADEFVDRYVGGNLAVTITLSYPELVMVVLGKELPTPASYRYRGPTSGLGAQLKRRYYARLEAPGKADGELALMQERYADLAAGDLRKAIERLVRRPSARMTKAWALSSHRFPT